MDITIEAWFIAQVTINFASGKTFENFAFSAEGTFDISNSDHSALIGKSLHDLNCPAISLLLEDALGENLPR